MNTTRIILILTTLIGFRAWAGNAESDVSRPLREEPTAYRSVIHPYDERGRPNPEAFDWSGISLGIHGGTLGAGAETTVHLTPWLNFRVTGTYLSFTYKTTVDKIDYDYDLEALSARLMLDLYPARLKNFRFSIGLVVKDMDIDVSGAPNRNVMIGDRVYTPEEVGSLGGRASYDTFAPYLGIGFGNSVKPDALLTFSLDIGVMLHDYSFRLSSRGDGAGRDSFARDLESHQSDVEETLDWLKIYPVISFGLAYHF